MQEGINGGTLRTDCGFHRPRRSSRGLEYSDLVLGRHPNRRGGVPGGKARQFAGPGPATPDSRAGVAGCSRPSIVQVESE